MAHLFYLCYRPLERRCFFIIVVAEPVEAVRLVSNLLYFVHFKLDLCGRICDYSSALNSTYKLVEQAAIVMFTQ